MHCEPSSEDGNIGCNTLDHLGISLAQLGEFHLDCILMCAHRFDFSSHVQDLMMTLMTQRGGRNMECSSQLRYDLISTTDDDSKFGRSCTLFSHGDYHLIKDLGTCYILKMGGIIVAQ